MRKKSDACRRSLAYASWRSMVARCTNPRDVNFPKYGPAGISVCARWGASFAAFLCDMGEMSHDDMIGFLANALARVPRIPRAELLAGVN